MRRSVETDRFMWLAAALFLFVWGLFVSHGQPVELEGTGEYLNPGCSRILGVVAIIASVAIVLYACNILG